MLKFFITSLFFLVSSVTFSQDTDNIKTSFPLPDTNNIQQYFIGGDSVGIYTRCSLLCDSNITFIQLHEDETTGIDAAEEYLMTHGGFLVQLKHTGKRLVNFKLGNQVFNVDPNRIFSRVGIKNNMTKLALYKPEAAKQVNVFANNILKNYVNDKKLIVALHNNTEEKFSILSYEKGMPEAPNAAEVFINDDMDPDDFILTTDTSIYRKIKDKNINVVLQSSKAKDDGSLSVYAQRKKIPYINIEAQHGHLDEQKQMLFALKDIIEGYRELVDLNYVEDK